MTKDKQGRSYARQSELKAGSIVTIDGDFSCLKSWTQHVVKEDGLGLYIECKEGEHHLAGQQDGPSDHYTGIYKGVVAEKLVA